MRKKNPLRDESLMGSAYVPRGHRSKEAVGLCSRSPLCFLTPEILMDFLCCMLLLWFAASRDAQRDRKKHIASNRMFLNCEPK